MKTSPSRGESSNLCGSENHGTSSWFYQENLSVAQGSKLLARAASFIILYRYRTFYIYLGHQISKIDCKYFKTKPHLLRANQLEHKRKSKLKLWFSRLINLQERKLSKMNLFIKYFPDYGNEYLTVSDGRKRKYQTSYRILCAESRIK